MVGSKLKPKFRTSKGFSKLKKLNFCFFLFLSSNLLSLKKVKIYIKIKIGSNNRYIAAKVKDF